MKKQTKKTYEWGEEEKLLIDLMAKFPHLTPTEANMELKDLLPKGCGIRQIQGKLSTSKFKNACEKIIEKTSGNFF